MATLLDKEAINTACRDEKYSRKDRLLDPTNTMHSFMLQVLNARERGFFCQNIFDYNYIKAEVVEE